MIWYFDASSLVKLYLEEDGSEQVWEGARAAEVAGTTEISFVEVHSALAKASRMGVLTPDQASLVEAAFEEQWPKLQKIRFNPSIRARAARLTWSHELKAYDAVQLATALAWREAMDEPVVFSTFDRRLWWAAQDHRLYPHPEEEP